MARIPDEVLERIKRDVSVLRLAESMGTAFKKNGDDNFIGLCPWHDDKNPSLVISVKKNVFHCLGCGAKGSPIDWVMRQYGVSFRHAAELLQEGLPANGSTPAGSAKSSRVRHLPPPIDIDADDQEALRQVVDFYHETLKSSPEALDYLEARGLHSQEAIEHFRLGYANRTLGYRLPQKTRKLGEELRSRLQGLGIYRDSGHEHFNGSLVVPVFGDDGAVTEIYGRKITPALRKGTPLHLYLPGPHRGVWNVDALKASTEIILCEALLDALTFWVHGYRNVTSSYGVNGFTDEHLEAFRRHGTERVLIAYDRDDAGNSAAATLSEKLIAEGIECYRVELPRGMDVNEYALKVTPASKSLDLVLRKASWLGKGKPPASKPPLDRVRAPASSLISLAAKEELSLAAKEDRLLAAKEETSSAREAAPAADAQPLPAVSLASPTPPACGLDVPVEVSGEEVVIRLGQRRYRVRGLSTQLAYDQLKVNLHVSHSRPDDGEPDLERGTFVDRVDLYTASRRAAFVKQAALELGLNETIVQRDLGKVLYALERLQDKQIKHTLEPVEETVELSDGDRKAALELLTAPNLLERILVDFERCGVVGEEANKLLGYIAAVSRKLEEPLAVLVQSMSAAGKSSLMQAILELVPEEERTQYSAMTGQSLFYMKETKLKHKVLAIAEGEGAERASYALKLLQSEGQLTIATTGKDPDTGQLVTEDRQVEGPVMLMLTTTAIELDEELMNRCLVLTVNEDRAQTRAIHQLQRARQTLAGQLARRAANDVRQLHHNAQRLLRPLLVVNPYAHQLRFADERPRMRRDHMKYLTLIRSVALLHQHQRKVKEALDSNGNKVEYIEVTVQDIAVVNELAHEVLGRSLDELAPQTRRLLEALEEMVTEEGGREEVERSVYRFTRRQVRERTGWGLTQLRVHLARLVELEYVLVHRGRSGQSFVYELMYDGAGKDGKSFVNGLLDASELGESTYDANLAGLRAHLAGSKRGQNGPETGGWRPAETDSKQLKKNELQVVEVVVTAESTVPGRSSSPPSYAQAEAVR